jgi:hypothetical protein
MARGNQREKAREKNLKKEADKKKGGKPAPKVGGANADAAALQAKKAEKAKRLADEAANGTAKTKDRGSQYSNNKKDKVANVVNPHTGKKDPKLTKKLVK